MKVLKITKDELYYLILNFIKENGLSNFTYRKLAAYCGVSVGTIFNYFGDKDSIIENILNDYWERSFGQMVSHNLKMGNDFMETISILYEDLSKNSTEFNEVFGDSNLSGAVGEMNIYAPVLTKTTNIIASHIAQIIEYFPDVKTKVEAVSSIDEFAMYITNNFIMRMKDRRETLGLFGTVLKDFLK